MENHEFLADAQVMKNGTNMDSYAYLLVQYRNYISKSPLMSGFIFRQTKNRINMLYKQKNLNFVMLLKSGMVLGLFSMVFTWCSFSGNSGNDRFLVVVDPGHGGDNPGGAGVEKTIYLQIADNVYMGLLEIKAEN